MNTNCIESQLKHPWRARRGSTYVDRRVVLCVVAHGKVDPLVLWGKVRSRSGVALDDLNLIGGTDTALEKYTCGTERSRRQDYTAVGRYGDEAVRAKRSVVGMDTEDLRTVADDVRDHDIVLVHEV